MIRNINNFFGRVCTKVRQLNGDNKGIAAIEFALISPLLITLYLGTLEIAGAIQMNTKVGRAASIAGNMVGQPATINRDAIDAILRIGKATTQPYNLTMPIIKLTGIEIDASGVAKVAWSRKIVNNTFSDAYTKGSTIIIPSTVKINGTFLIKAEAELQYRTLTSWSIKQAAGQNFGTVDMAETYYWTPLNASQNLVCTDC